MLSQNFLVCDKETNVVVDTHWTKKGAMKRAKKLSHSANEAGKYLAIRAKIAYHIGDICPMMQVEKIFSHELKKKHDILVKAEKEAQQKALDEAAAAKAVEEEKPKAKRTRKTAGATSGRISNKKKVE